VTYFPFRSRGYGFGSLFAGGGAVGWTQTPKHERFEIQHSVTASEKPNIFNGLADLYNVKICSIFTVSRYAFYGGLGFRKANKFNDLTKFTCRNLQIYKTAYFATLQFTTLQFAIYKIYRVKLLRQLGGFKPVALGQDAPESMMHQNP
jgi:hypothetical protein